MHLYLEGTVKDVDTIRYSSAESMRQRGVKVFPETKVLEIFPDRHEIKVLDLKTKQERLETYDRLILGAGVSPNLPSIEGLDLDRVMLYAGRESAVTLRQLAVSPEVKDVAIIGAGYIALEAAISFAKAGKQVTMLNRSDRILRTHLDPELSELLAAEIAANGIKHLENVSVNSLKGQDGKVNYVVTDQGEIPAQLVIVSIGNHPNTDWLKGSLDLDQRGFVIVDDYMKTSAPDVFAAGSCTAMKANAIESKMSVDLATNARKQGRVAAKNLEADVFAYPGMQATSGLKVFDYYFASTGINSSYRKLTDIEFDSIYLETTALDQYLPEDLNAKVHAKLFFDPKTRRVLGGQVLSKHDMSGLIQALSVAIYSKLSVDELAFADFFFQPLFNRPWNLLNELGLAAQKKLG